MLEMENSDRFSEVPEDLKMMPATTYGTESSIKIEDEATKRRMSESANVTRFRRYVEIFVAETIATSLLLGIGCMSCVDGITTNPVTDFHSAITFGFTVSTMICTFGHITAAHMNPAVTIAFFVMGKTKAGEVPVYFAAELLGATAGMSFLKMVTPAENFGDALCVTRVAEGVGALEGLAVEFAITFMLIAMICGLSDSRNERNQDSVPLKFAAVIIAVSFAAGKYTGASMNPARSFGPAFITNNWSSHWIYWVGPISAAVTAPLVYNFFKKDDYV